MKKNVVILGTIAAIIGVIATAVYYFIWLPKQMHFLSPDFEDTEFDI